MALAPRTVQNMPDLLRRELMTPLQPASMTPDKRQTSYQWPTSM
jgi:hypothetical protein